MNRSIPERFENSLEGDLPGGWEDEVKEILERAEALEKKTGRRQPIPLPRVGRRRLNPVVAVGDFIMKRIATTRDMVTTGMVIIFIALFLAVVPGGRYISPVLVLVGIGLLLTAYLLAFRANRKGREQPSGPRMWRGQVIEQDEPSDEGFLKRLFNRGDRDR